MQFPEFFLLISKKVNCFEMTYQISSNNFTLKHLGWILTLKKNGKMLSSRYADDLKHFKELIH